MKVCPVCKARVFDDMVQCFGCLHRFEEDGAPPETVSSGSVSSEPARSHSAPSEAVPSETLSSEMPSRPVSSESAPSDASFRDEQPVCAAAPVAEATIVPDAEGGASIRIEIRLAGLETCIRRPRHGKMPAGVT